MTKRLRAAFGLTVRLRSVRLVASLSFAAALLLVPSAPATVPGTNGLIAFRANTGSGDQI